MNPDKPFAATLFVAEASRIDPWIPENVPKEMPE